MPQPFSNPKPNNPKPCFGEARLRIEKNLERVRGRIQKLDVNHQVTLIAVSKTKPVSDVQHAIDCGQKHFGENYLQEALKKIEILKNHNLIWHFIGPIQSNKTAKIAQNFNWVHSVDRLKIAQRLNDQRPIKMGKLNILLQINIDNEPTKSGILKDEINKTIKQFKDFNNIVLRGFMCIPNPNNAEQSFKKISQIIRQYPQFDTLSMGMSADLELAIKNGATFVRVGSDIFGKRT